MVGNFVPGRGPSSTTIASGRLQEHQGLKPVCCMRKQLGEPAMSRFYTSAANEGWAELGGQSQAGSRRDPGQMSAKKFLYLSWRAERSALH
jgi:hypothetical protein